MRYTLQGCVSVHHNTCMAAHLVAQFMYMLLSANAACLPFLQ